MDFTWPPLDAGRPSDASRGIETNGATCYQVSVLQTLLHQPPFLRWIVGHNTDELLCSVNDCLACFLKQLVEESWDDSDPADPVEYDDNDPQSIDKEACSSGMFVRYAHEDAGLFFMCILDTLYNSGLKMPKAKRHIHNDFVFD